MKLEMVMLNLSSLRPGARHSRWSHATVSRMPRISVSVSPLKTQKENNKEKKSEDVEKEISGGLI